MQLPVDNQQQVFSDTRLQYQHLDATPAAFGGAVAQAGENAANQFVQRDLEAQANKADLNFGQQLDTLLNDPKTGLRAKNGQDAIDALPDFQSSVKQAMADARSQLAPNAARMFEQVAQRRAMMIMQDGTGYVAQAKHQMDGAVWDGRIALDANNIANNVDNPKALSTHMATMRDDVLGKAKWMGVAGTPVEGELLAKHTSDAYANAILQTMSSDPGKAADMLKQFGAYLQPGAKAEIESRVNRATADNDVVTVATQAVESARRPLFDSAGHMLAHSTDDLENQSDMVAKNASDAYLAAHPGDQVGAHRTAAEARQGWETGVIRPALRQQ